MIGLSTYSFFWQHSAEAPEPLDLPTMLRRTRELGVELFQRGRRAGGRQGHAGGVVACGVGCLPHAVVQAKAADHHAACGTQATPGGHRFDEAQQRTAATW